MSLDVESPQITGGASTPAESSPGLVPPDDVDTPSTSTVSTPSAIGMETEPKASTLEGIGQHAGDVLPERDSSAESSGRDAHESQEDHRSPNEGEKSSAEKGDVEPPCVCHERHSHQALSILTFPDMCRACRREAVMTYEFEIGRLKRLDPEYVLFHYI